MRKITLFTFFVSCFTVIKAQQQLVLNISDMGINTLLLLPDSSKEKIIQSIDFVVKCRHNDSIETITFPFNYLMEDQVVTINYPDSMKLLSIRTVVTYKDYVDPLLGSRFKSLAEKAYYSILKKQKINTEMSFKWVSHPGGGTAMHRIMYTTSTYESGEIPLVNCLISSNPKDADVFVVSKKRWVETWHLNYPPVEGYVLPDEIRNRITTYKFGNTANAVQLNLTEMPYLVIYKRSGKYYFEPFNPSAITHLTTLNRDLP